MELTKTNGFCEMNEMEMQEVDGGGIWDFITCAIGGNVGFWVYQDLTNCYDIGYGSVIEENKK